MPVLEPTRFFSVRQCAAVSRVGGGHARKFLLRFRGAIRCIDTRQGKTLRRIGTSYSPAVLVALVAGFRTQLKRAQDDRLLYADVDKLAHFETDPEAVSLDESPPRTNGGGGGGGVGGHRGIFSRVSC